MELEKMDLLELRQQVIAGSAHILQGRIYPQAVTAFDELARRLALKDADLLLERDRAEKAKATANLLRDELMNPPPDIQERVLKLLGIWPLYDYTAALERAEKADVELCKALVDLDDAKMQVKMLVEALKAVIAWDEGGEGSWDLAGPHTRPFEKAKTVLAKIKEEL